MDSEVEIVHRRWPDAESFYAERDHRTALEVENLHAYVHRPVEIHTAAQSADDLTTQRIALVAANLTARWARKVRVIVPDVALRPPLHGAGNGSLGARIEREMRQVDPFGDFTVSHDSATSMDHLRLFVGATPQVPVTGQDYVVSADGWSALGWRGSSARPSLNPGAAAGAAAAAAPAAALAGAIGAGDLFKRAVGHAPRHWLGCVNWCTWSHTLRPDFLPAPEAPRVPHRADLGTLLVAGVGAVGSALLYILTLTDVEARIAVLDRDSVETSNLNRSLLFVALDAALGRFKTTVAREALEAHGIATEVVFGTWSHHGEALSRRGFDAWVSLTNEDRAWAEVPYQLPPTVIHGTTTSGWGVGLGRHIPRLEDCTACRLPRPEAEFRGPCAEGDLSDPISEPSVEPPRASLPFLSAAAAALVAAELMKLPLAGVASLPNAVTADFLFGLPALLSYSLGPTAKCAGCRMASLPAWQERGGRSRYAGLCKAQN